MPDQNLAKNDGKLLHAKFFEMNEIVKNLSGYNIKTSGYCLLILTFVQPFPLREALIASLQIRSKAKTVFSIKAK